jgi:hypothetical protein
MKHRLPQARRSALTSALESLPSTAPANEVLKVIKEHMGPANMKHVRQDFAYAL